MQLSSTLNECISTQPLKGYLIYSDHTAPLQYKQYIHCNNEYTFYVNEQALVTHKGGSSPITPINTSEILIKALNISQKKPELPLYNCILYIDSTKTFRWFNQNIDVEDGLQVIRKSGAVNEMEYKKIAAEVHNERSDKKIGLVSFLHLYESEKSEKSEEYIEREEEEQETDTLVVDKATYKKYAAEHAALKAKYKTAPENEQLNQEYMFFRNIRENLFNALPIILQTRIERAGFDISEIKSFIGRNNNIRSDCGLYYIYSRKLLNIVDKQIALDKKVQQNNNIWANTVVNKVSPEEKKKESAI